MALRLPNVLLPLLTSYTPSMAVLVLTVSAAAAGELKRSQPDVSGITTLYSFLHEIKMRVSDIMISFFTV
jgi:hypothetical protein